MCRHKVELPINISDIECITECWTFNRLIILSNSPYYLDWLASHYNLYVSGGRFHFEQLLNTPEMYDTILHRKQLRYFEMTEDTIVDRFKEELNRGYYLNVMTTPYLNKNWYHELVLYGYDDSENIFYAVGIEGHIFKKEQYTYQFMVDMLKGVKYYFKNEEFKRGMKLSEFFQYPISVFKLREDYSNESCVFGAFHKLRVELDGKKYGEGIRSVNNWTYTGIDCLYALGDLLKEMIDGDGGDLSNLLKIESVVKLLHEHRKMMIISMKYLQEKWNKALGKRFSDNIEGYEKCCDIVETWLYIAIKYKVTNNKTLLDRIIEEIPGVYEKEYMYLDNMVNHCIDWKCFNEYYI